MAIPVARVHLAMAHAALPALLPTPPRTKMLPLLPTPRQCVLAILPAVSPPKPAASRADADERWDARKNAIKSPPVPKPCRADAAQRWDAGKTMKSASSGSGQLGQRSPDGESTGSSGRASSSCERWDSKKKGTASSSSSSSSASRASSAGRWDAHKKTRPPQADGTEDDDGQSSTGSNESMELDMPRRALYAGPGFLVAAPEPSMLPMPSAFMMRVAA